MTKFGNVYKFNLILCKPLTLPPAAARTIQGFLADSGKKASDFDLILTGDLGYTGTELLHEVLQIEHHLDIRSVHGDCGLMIYDLKRQDVNSGGSGCGCSGSVVCSHIVKRMKKGELRRVLFVATGALMSPTSAKQGQPIPGIAHAVLLER